jgi:hypothetical protein
MGQSTSCGLSHTHLISVPNIGDFRLGWEDYEINRVGGEGSLKIISNRVLSTVEPGHWSFEVTLYQMHINTYVALRNQAYISLNNFLATGTGDIIVNFNGTNNYCYIVKLNPGVSYFDNTSVQYFETVTISLIDPNNGFF